MDASLTSNEKGEETSREASSTDISSSLKYDDPEMQIEDADDTVTHAQVPPPDGGLTAWLQVAGGHLTIIATWGFILSFGVFQSYYTTALGVDRSTISWIGSLQIFFLFSLGSVTGRALDGGYFRIVYTTGSVFIILGIFLASLGTKYWHILLTQGVMCGLGNGMIFCPALALTSTYFHKRRNLAIGLAACGSATGGIIVPVMVQQLLPMVGFPWTMRILGFFLLVVLGAANMVMRVRVTPRKSGGLVELGAFKEAPYTLFTIGMFLTFMGLYFGFFYISAFARERLGLSQEKAFTMLIVMNAIAVPMRIIPNYIADRKTGPLNGLIPFSAGVALLMFCWVAVRDEPGVMAWSAFYGIFSSGIQGLFPATISSLTTDVTKAGTRMGMVFTIVSFACLSGPPIGGALVQLQGGRYWAAQIFSGACMLCGLLVLVAARISKTGLVFRARM